MGNFEPTDEQQRALELYATGEHLAIEAGAGTGKTSTLVLLAESDLERSVQYTAFNKAIVSDVGRKLPQNAEANTAHSLAFRTVGKTYSHRLNAPRVSSHKLAQMLGVGPIMLNTGFGQKVLQPDFLASLVMRSVELYCQSADGLPEMKHVPYLDGIDLPDAGGRRTYRNNDIVREHLAPYLRAAWRDINDPMGGLPFKHCQPPGTLVRRVTQYGGGIAGQGKYDDVPIETVRPGDRVVSFSMERRRGYVRRAGREVSSVQQRDFSGELVVVTTNRGRCSAYTPEHRCVVCFDAPLTDGNYIVYLARQGDNFRIGRTTWRTKSQQNALGLRRRADAQRADAMWVLSVHESERESALAEALVAHRHRIPTWQFQSTNETMPLAEFWTKVGNNVANAAACLLAHGRDLRFPFWQRSGGYVDTRTPQVIQAVNLLSGLLVLEPDEMKPTSRGALPAHRGSGGWAPIQVVRSSYEGPVFSLAVDTDETYVADGIVTHNSHYMKMWERGDPVIAADVICFDEAQDASPVLMSAVQQQEHAQVVWCGDQNQAIYGFTGAVDAFSHLAEGTLRSRLTRSFRFGPAVAEVANVILGCLDTDMELVGHDPIPTTCGWIKDTADAILTRTNSTAVREVLGFQKRGVAVHLVGGGADIASFARGAEKLMQRQPTSHPELACFNSWNEVQEYVRQDPSGDDLRLMVQLVDEFTVPIILEALEGGVSEAHAEVVVSTAHKAKGREWNRVQLAADFPESVENEADWKLLYVAVTRAKLRLDYFGTKAVVDLAFDAGIIPQDVRTDPTARLTPVGGGDGFDGMTEMQSQSPRAPTFPAPPAPLPVGRPRPSPVPALVQTPAQPVDPDSPARLFDDVEI